jgi:hypothetical protein
MRLRMRLKPHKDTAAVAAMRERLAGSARVFDVLLESPAFVVLRRDEREFLFAGLYPLGAALPRGLSGDAAIAAYRDLQVAGAVKVAAEFAVVDGELRTETRVWAPAGRTRAWFRVYWLFIRLGSGLLRRAVLKAALR